MENEIVKLILAISRISKDMSKMATELEDLSNFLQSEDFLKAILQQPILTNEDYD